MKNYFIINGSIHFSVLILHGVLDHISIPTQSIVQPDTDKLKTKQTFGVNGCSFYLPE